MLVDKKNNGTRTIQMGKFKSYPCGGTHVHNIDEVGKIIIKSVKFKKRKGLRFLMILNINDDTCERVYETPSTM